MTAETQKNLRAFVEGIAVATITRPSQRDKQQAPGPSDLSSKCELCIAKSIARSLGMGDYADSGFSLKAWLGTCVHEKLERDLPSVYPHAEREITVEIGDVPGVGLVKGHVDLYLPRKAAAVDWKTTDMNRLKKYRTQAGPSAYTQGLTPQERADLADFKIRDRAGKLTKEELAPMIDLMSRSQDHSGGVPEEYLGQTMLYLMGLRAGDRPAEYAVLVFIPRDSNNVSDIWVASCAYRPDVAEGVLRRASKIAETVRSGLLNTIEPHPECFPCVIRPRLNR